MTVHSIAPNLQREIQKIAEKTKMPNSKNSIKNLGILSLFLATILLLCSWQPVTYRASNFKNKQEKSRTELVKDDLDLALEKASMANKTVIITIINKAYVEPHEDEYPTMLDLFLEGFWIGENTRALVDHVLVVSMDKIAYEMCEFRRLNCYNLAAHDGAVAVAGNQFSRETVYMSDEFVEMMWRRTLFLLDVLKRGYNFIFTDTDVLWLRNPLTRLMKNGSVDLQISVDKYNRIKPFRKIYINTGFYFIRSNNKTTSLFQKWYDMRKNSTGIKDQDVLAGLITSGFLGKLKLDSENLDTLYFSGFCQDSRDIRSVFTVHANCCMTIKAKVVDLKAVLRDWKKFKNEENNGDYNSRNSTKQYFRWSKHTSCISSWPKKTRKSTLG